MGSGFYFQAPMMSFVLAARPKTLPAAIVPVWVGCALAYRLTGTWDGWLAFYTIMGALWIQIATNFFNDAIDADKGADTDARLGPIRATASGRLSRKTVYISAMVCLLLAASPPGVTLAWRFLDDSGRFGRRIWNLKRRTTRRTLPLPPAASSGTGN